LAAASANLFVQYVYQGTIKEIATTATIIAAFAIGSEAIRARQPYRGVAVTSIPLAATLCTYGVAGGPYVLGMIGAVALYLVVVERRVPRPAWFGPSLVGGALVVALAIPAVVEFSTLFNIAQAVVGSANPTGNALGTLARPLPISQISGVWLDGDFRLPVVAEPAGDLTVIASVAILVLAIPGVLTSIRRRDPAPLLATVTTGLVLLIVVPRVTPYAVGKVYAMASPIVVWTAGIGLSAFAWRRLAPLAVAIGVALTVAILASDLLAYHEDHPSPTSKMLAVQAMAEHFAGRGPLLLNEDDEFDKYFARAAETDVAFDSLSPRQAILIAPDTLFDQFYDLDQETLAYAESFPLIVTRRSPIASRPPSNFKLVYSNRYYLGWARQPGPTVVSHLSLQSQWGGTATPPCTAVESLAHDAPHGSELIAAVTPVSTGFDILGAPSRPANWGLNLNPYGSVTPIGPGYVHEIVTVPASGSYQAWVQGSFSRPVSVLVDNRAVGSVDGLDSIDQWSEAGVVRLSAGRHELAIRRGGGRIYPGDGTTLSEIGYVTLKEVGPERLVHVSLSSWHTLCGRPADWIELVRP
jgi:hypothetical protein